MIVKMRSFALTVDYTVSHPSLIYQKKNETIFPILSQETVNQEKLSWYWNKTETKKMNRNCLPESKFTLMLVIKEGCFMIRRQIKTFKTIVFPHIET